MNNKTNTNSDEPETCTNCGKMLNKNDIVWLDDPNYLAVYREINGPDYANAWAFGKACAKSVLNNNGVLLR